MSDQHPHDIDERLRRMLGDAEPGDDALVADPDMRRLIELLDTVEPDDQLEAPPPRLWDAIAEGAGLSGSTADPGQAAPRLASVQPVVSDSEPAPSVEAPSRRPGTAAAPPWWLGAAAAVVVVLVIAIGAFAIITTGDTELDQVATAELDVLVDAAATGGATLVRDEDTFVLQVDVDGLDDIDGYYEVWLLTPEVDGLVSLGPLRSDGRHELPAGLDHTRFSVVDISIEPHDGDPNHSGNSVLRGGLVEA